MASHAMSSIAAVHGQEQEPGERGSGMDDATFQRLRDLGYFQ